MSTIPYAEPVHMPMMYPSTYLPYYPRGQTFMPASFSTNPYMMAVTPSFYPVYNRSAEVVYSDKTYLMPSTMKAIPNFNLLAELSKKELNSIQHVKGQATVWL